MQPDIPAIGITIQNQLDDYRSVVFQSFIARDCTNGELDGVLDKLRRAAERQKAAISLPTIRGLLADKRAGLKQETETLFGVESEQGLMRSAWANANGERRSDRLTPQQKQDEDRLKQAHGRSMQNITVLQKEIAVYERQVADMEAKLAAED